MRLIDANVLREKAQYSNQFESDEQIIFLDDIDNAPTVDAVPVVRCRECKHRKEKTFWCEKVQDFISNPKWFCADGERKERKGGDE